MTLIFKGMSPLKCSSTRDKSEKFAKMIKGVLISVNGLMTKTAVCSLAEECWSQKMEDFLKASLLMDF